LPAVLQQATEMLAQKAREKGLDLVSIIEPAVPARLRGDPSRLRQILLNLGGNAVKFTPCGKVILQAQLARQNETSAEIRFSVQDTGIGIAADRQSDIFLPFTQVDGSTTRKYGGTGLGLSISKQLVELMGGRIGAESQLGTGSTFWFTLAFEKQDERAVIRTEPMRATPHCPEVKQDARILIADDNLTSQEVALAVVKKLGYCADAVANGKEALTALRSVPYDLVLLDCQMPEMNGYEAASRIRKSEAGVVNREIPIVALTAHAMNGDRQKCLASGMDDYVAKPVGPATLDAVIRKWLPKDGGRMEMARSAIARAAPIAAFDRAALLDRMMGDRHMTKTIIDAFLDDMPRQFSALASHLKDGDARGAEYLIHRIKGAAANVNAGALREQASELEQLVRSGNLKGVAAKFGDLEQQFHAAESEMKKQNECCPNGAD